MTQLGAPAVGEVLADRYRLEEHVDDDSSGRKVWRGVDVILQRAVTVVLHVPGGDEAEEMLSAAVASSRVIHPHIIGVYDAIDEGDRAYVIREWVDGRSLRDVVREAPMEPWRAAAVAHAVADALAAVHATGVAHGNVHPGTVLISYDGRVVLADARASAKATRESDVRAVGGVLYCALTGHWPKDGAGPAPHAETRRGGQSSLAGPRQVRGGIPRYLDKLTMDLLNESVPPPAAAELSAELARLQATPDGVTEGSPLDFVTASAAAGYPPPIPGENRQVWKKVVAGAAGLLVIAVAGLLVGTRWLPTGDAGGVATQSPTAAPGDAPGDGANAQPVKLGPDQVRIVDPEDDRTANDDELDDAERAVDGNPETAWRTHWYTSPKFGNIRNKVGMGIFIDLGSKRSLTTVEIQLSTPGATIDVRAGDADPGEGQAGDRAIVRQYKSIGDASDKPAQATVVRRVDVETRYLLIWITELPRNEDPKRPNTFRLGIQEVIITAR